MPFGLPSTTCRTSAHIASNDHLVYKVHSPSVVKCERNFCPLRIPTLKQRLNATKTLMRDNKTSPSGTWQHFFRNVTITNLAPIDACFKQTFSIVLESPNVYKIHHISYFPKFLLNVWAKSRFLSMTQTDEGSLLTFWENYCLFSTNSLNV